VLIPPAINPRANVPITTVTEIRAAVDFVVVTVFTTNTTGLGAGADVGAAVVTFGVGAGVGAIVGATVRHGGLQSSITVITVASELFTETAEEQFASIKQSSVPGVRRTIAALTHPGSA